MSNSFTGLITTLIANDTIEFLRSKSATLGRIHVENRQEMNVLEGGNTVNIPKPVSKFTPTAVSYASAAVAQSITVPYVALTFGNHYEVKVQANMLESRQSAGNFARIIQLTVPGMLEGLVSQIDQSVTALYSSLTTTPVGTPGVALTDATFRSAIATLSANNVYPEMGDVHFCVNPSVYWNQLVGLSQYQPAYAVGDASTIREGNLKTLYDCNVSYSPNIVTTASSPTTIENLLFHRDAFVIGFVEFEPVNKYADKAQVEESIVTDPISGVSLRVMRYLDPDLKTWIYNIDVKWGVAVLDGARGIVVQA
jgi:hypothetical protein